MGLVQSGFHFGGACCEQRTAIARRDQCAPRSASWIVGRPVPLSTTPIPRRKGRTRHERHLEFARKRGGFRLELGVVAPALRLHLTPFRPLRPPLSRRQLQTETNDVFLARRRPIRMAQSASTNTG